MGKQLEQLVLAALVHDTGKLFERADLFAEARRDEHYLGMCPRDRDTGRPTHLHCAHTRAFCDWLEQHFDCLRQATDRSWKDWAAAHHSDEPGLPFRVIRLADVYSAQEREPGSYYTPEVNRRTLLESVLERVTLPGCQSALATQNRYPLKPQGVDRDSLFPVPGEKLAVKPMAGAAGAITDPSAWNHLLRPMDQLLTRDYRQLGDGLLGEIKTIAEKTPGVSLGALLVTLTTLLEKYTGNVPSATNVRHPDISLFDHLRTTAAIAQALYLQQLAQAKAEQGLGDKEENKWVLACGDFSGIQKFIYRLTNKGAAKGLRGRSFYVQLFCRLCADYLLRELGLTRLAMLYNSGGKFYLLLPAHLKGRLN